MKFRISLLTIYKLPVAGTYVYRLIEIGRKNEERALLGVWKNDYQFIAHFLFLNIPIFKKSWV